MAETIKQIGVKQFNLIKSKIDALGKKKEVIKAKTYQKLDETIDSFKKSFKNILPDLFLDLKESREILQRNNDYIKYVGNQYY